MQNAPSRLLRRSTAGLAAAMGATMLLAAPAAAQAKPDQLFRYNERTKKTQAIPCTITSDGLAKVVATRRDGRDLTVDSVDVVEIVWGQVPPSFTDGMTYAKRADWESAVTSFQETAGDSDARAPIQAVARMHALEALLAWGATDSARFTDAVSEADRFLADHSDNRHVPAVRALKARAAWLSGDAVAARDGYRALFDAGNGGTEGYRPLDTAQAALAGAYAALAADDTTGARELFGLARTAFSGITSDIPTISAAAAAGAEVAGLGDAMAQLAGGDAGRARSAFESAARDSKTSAGAATARLGLGRVFLAEGKPRKAQREFAWVAGLDHTDGDRRAEALVGMAEATLAAGGDDAAVQAKSALDRVLTQYGATPAATRATKLLESM
ncbi:MAG: hypothetical protein AAF957_27360 [Planctomycetota bacterium]